MPWTDTPWTDTPCTASLALRVENLALEADILCLTETWFTLRAQILLPVLLLVSAVTNSLNIDTMYSWGCFCCCFGGFFVCLFIYSRSFPGAFIQIQILDKRLDVWQFPRCSLVYVRVRRERGDQWRDE